MASKHFSLRLIEILNLECESYVQFSNYIQLDKTRTEINENKLGNLQKRKMIMNSLKNYECFYNYFEYIGYLGILR